MHTRGGSAKDVTQRGGWLEWEAHIFSGEHIVGARDDTHRSGLEVHNFTNTRQSKVMGSKEVTTRVRQRDGIYISTSEREVPGWENRFPFKEHSVAVTGCYLGGMRRGGQSLYMLIWSSTNGEQRDSIDSLTGWGTECLVDA